MKAVYPHFLLGHNDHHQSDNCIEQNWLFSCYTACSPYSILILCNCITLLTETTISLSADWQRHIGVLLALNYIQTVSSQRKLVVHDVNYHVPLQFNSFGCINESPNGLCNVLQPTVGFGSSPY